ncbi:MAG: flavin-containing monooxygenase [Blastocatellia bacterium]
MATMTDATQLSPEVTDGPVRADLEDPALGPLDVVIIGAGLSGIGAAVQLRRHFPAKRLAILEARSSMGGTWDLFRYPGIRSDSDMHTLGYRFKPWRNPKAIADGPSIRAYVEETAREHGLLPLIHFGHALVRADWSSPEANWILTVEHEGRSRQLRTRHLMMCAGYYRYTAGYTPAFEGLDQYQGQLIHPQHWPESLDYQGKRILVIGSGATAVTLVPALATQAAHVTMLQRSPTYMAVAPSVDRIANLLRRWLPPRTAYFLSRWKNILFQMAVFQFSRRYPKLMATRLIEMVRQELGQDFDVTTHFTPRYNPWQERLCLVPDSDFFAAMREGKVDIVTDQIECFTPTGVRLASGRTLEADLVVTATGLQLQFAGGATMTVDGEPIETGQRVLYKGAMLHGVPNLVTVFGYTNASWTLRADLLSDYFCRLIRHMDRHGYVEARPAGPAPEMALRPAVNLQSGYFRRSDHLIPREGDRGPWTNPQNYLRDLIRFRFSPIADGVLSFRPH